MNTFGSFVTSKIYNGNDYITSETSFFDACRNDDMETVKKYLEQHEEIDQTVIEWALEISSIFNRLNIVKILLNRKNVNDPNYIRITNWASSDTFMEIVKLNDVYCKIYNGDDKTLRVIGNEMNYSMSTLEKLKEEYIKWQYRIGGEKYNTSLESLGITQNK